MLNIGAELKSQLAREIGPNGVMLFPTYTRTAPRHYLPLLMPHHAAYTAIMNVMEMPVTQVPMGLDGKGLPSGFRLRRFLETITSVLPWPSPSNRRSVAGCRPGRYESLESAKASLDEDDSQDEEGRHHKVTEMGLIHSLRQSNAVHTPAKMAGEKRSWS